MEKKGQPAHAFQYVGSEVLSYLLGIPSGTIRNQISNTSSSFLQVSFITPGTSGYRKYSFYDVAKLAYPYLTDYEIARLRVEINAMMKQERRLIKAEKSGSRENVR